MDKETLVVRSSAKMEEDIPSLANGTKVYVDNKEHQFHLAPGVIICKDHGHYRLSLSFNDGKRTRNIEIWVPEHWVKPMPKWFYE
ncbi:MAG: hypothetical protein Q8K86_07230 [Candidatus Nanopelagicaceae bacterium]|nr:hypothetical protein [Candidatus Nanopelagicaceae bacterium]